MKNGKLIVFEGIDGSGKTTQSKALHAQLLDLGIGSRWFREPGDSPAGRRIRELAMTEELLSPEAELALFVSDRRENVSQNLLPGIAAGQIIILDRYYFSSACYQAARGLDMGSILSLHSRFAPQPDLAIYIDVEVEAALARISKGRNSRAIRFEIGDYLAKVRANYLCLCEMGLLVRVDGNGSEACVRQEIRHLCEKALAIHH